MEKKEEKKALARRRGLTDAGGFLDISLDFLFYALSRPSVTLARKVSASTTGSCCTIATPWRVSLLCHSTSYRFACKQY